jgi:alkylation response protein AidB-like acyl-CoA dehydrogenase
MLAYFDSDHLLLQRRARAWAEGYFPRDRGEEADVEKAARGEMIAAFALTEPEAGSDIASIKTRAVKRGGKYSLTGVKSFISNAGIAHHYVVFASTEPRKKGKGVSAFVVDSKSRGLIVKEKTRLLSRHPIGVIAFENCVAPESNLLGREGDGIKIALSTGQTFRHRGGTANRRSGAADPRRNRPGGGYADRPALQRRSRLENLRRNVRDSEAGDCAQPTAKIILNFEF